MLVRFALLAELHDDAPAPTPVQPAVPLAFACYGRVLGAGTLECWWPVLRELAGDWVRQRQTS